MATNVPTQDAEIVRLTEINRKLCADFNTMNQHGAKQDVALNAALARVRTLTGVIQQAFAFASTARPAGYETAILKIESLLETALKGDVV